MPKKIFKVPNIMLGLNNCTRPSSPFYKEGYAYKMTNSRIDKDGAINKGPVMVPLNPGPTVSDITGKTGNHVVPITIEETMIIADRLTAADSIASGINKWAYYLHGGTLYQSSALATVKNEVTYSVPSSAAVTISSSTGTRMETGLYFYLVTQYDSSRNVESLPFTYIREIYVRKYYKADIRQPDVPQIACVRTVRSVYDSIRIYRSKCIKLHKGDTVQSVQENVPTEFYFVAEGPVNDDFTHLDYAHDSEIARPENLYTGRGSNPPTSIDYIAKYGNRLFLFKGELAYWSSAGRPEEYPQEYSLTFAHTYTNGTWTGEDLIAGSVTYTTMSNYRPILDMGIQAAAIYRNRELMDESVKCAAEYDGKLWIFTEHTAGYMIPTTGSDGYKYVKVTDDIGICSAKTFAISPYGAFGADKRGVWQITDTMRRLSDGIIDIDDAAKDTYLNYTNYAAESFGVWVAELNEYWWSFQNSATPTYCQIVYQADSKRFVGPYNYYFVGGCSFVDTPYWRSYLSEIYLVSGYRPTLPSDRSTSTPGYMMPGVQTLKYWVGQETYGHVKDDILVSVYYDSITASQDITANTYCNKIATETGSNASANFTHNDDDLIGIIQPNESGRFIEISLSIPTTCTAPISGIDYEADLVPRYENAAR